LVSTSRLGIVLATGFHLAASQLYAVAECLFAML
jgi:hypothetical protein